jgi:hypothetical protein
MISIVEDEKKYKLKLKEASDSVNFLSKKRIYLEKVLLKSKKNKILIRDRIVQTEEYLKLQNRHYHVSVEKARHTFLLLLSSAKLFNERPTKAKLENMKLEKNRVFELLADQSSILSRMLETSSTLMSSKRLLKRIYYDNIIDELETTREKEKNSIRAINKLRDYLSLIGKKKASTEIRQLDERNWKARNDV